MKHNNRKAYEKVDDILGQIFEKFSSDLWLRALKSKTLVSIIVDLQNVNTRIMKFLSKESHAAWFSFIQAGAEAFLIYFYLHNNCRSEIFSD